MIFSQASESVKGYEEFHKERFTFIVSFMSTNLKFEKFYVEKNYVHLFTSKCLFDIKKNKKRKELIVSH